MQRRRFAHLHLLTLCSVAIAQPLYDLIGRNAEFLVAHRAGPWTIAALVGVLSLGIPLLLILAIEGTRAASERLATRLQIGLAGCLAGLTAAGALRQAATSIAVPLAILAGVAFVLAYRRSAVRAFLTIASASVVVFPLVFVLATPVSRLFRPWRTGRMDTAIQHRPPIVFVVFDELDTLSLLDETGEIDSKRFPNFSALTTTATWFPNATSAFPYTRDAVPAILTGIDADASTTRLPIAADHPKNVFTWLRGTYSMHVVEPLTRLCPPDVCAAAAADTEAAVLARDLAILYLHLIVPADLGAARLPPLTFSWKDFGSASQPRPAVAAMTEEELKAALDRAVKPGRAETFRQFVRDIEARPDPTLHFMHSMLPHDPYEYLPSGRTYPHGGLTAGMSASGVWTDDPALIATARERHRAQVGFVDTLLGELIARLKSQRLFDPALVIVTSDHGAAFEPGQSHRGMSAANYRGLVAAPLLLKLPFQAEGAVDTRRVSAVDIVPTIADVLGATLPWHADGRSVHAGTFPERTTLTYKKAGAIPPLDAFDVREEARRRHARDTSDAIAERPLTAFEPAAPRSQAYVFSDNFQSFQSVSLESGVVPALVQGQIEQPAGDERPLRLAIAVNGVVQATTTTTAWYGRSHYFAALVSDSAFRNGANQLDVLAIETVAGRPRLARLSSELSAGLMLRSTSAGERLVTAEGKEMPIAPLVAGVVDSVEVNPDGGVTLRGWAADRRTGRAVRSIVVFAGDAPVAVTTPAAPRPDVSAALGIPSVNVVWVLGVSAASLRRGAIRVFAVSTESVAGSVQFSSIGQQTIERQQALARQ